MDAIALLSALLSTTAPGCLTYQLPTKVGARHPYHT